MVGRATPAASSPTQKVPSAINLLFGVASSASIAVMRKLALRSVDVVRAMLIAQGGKAQR
jgi:hypothetical protein